jgi:hypothetical protein
MGSNVEKLSARDRISEALTLKAIFRHTTAGCKNVQNPVEILI